MSASYTPGPYVAHGRSDGRGLSWTVGRPETGRHFTLARIFRPVGDGPEVARANAILFAAAPDLVEALQWFIDDIDAKHGAGDNFDDAVARARTALSKALGEGEGM